MSVERRKLRGGRTVYLVRWREAGKNKGRHFDRLDRRMLRAEIAQLLTPGHYELAPRVRPLECVIECWGPRTARSLFLREARRLDLV